MTAPSTPPGGWFQAPTCGSLGLSLEMRMRNTARQLGSGESKEARAWLRIDLRAYRRGELVYSNADFGRVPAGGTLAVREADFPISRGSEADPEDELLLVARTHAEGAKETFFSQEHQLVYLHWPSGAQAHLLYDQQPARPRSAPAAPIVFMMPKIWLGPQLNTYVIVCNAWDAEAPQRQTEPVKFSLLDERGGEVCAWEHRFFYNEAKAFDLGRRSAGIAAALTEPRFFNLVGRGGAGSFVLFAVIRNTKSNHFAIEHSLPPLYYMDGAIGPVRAQGCDVSLFERGESR